jgi:hypothetical protein
MNRLIPELNSEDLKRFWSKVDRLDEEDCWEWLGKRNVKGYGLISLKGNWYLANRVMYLIDSGLDPFEKDVLHSCDNPCCINPYHLFLGTHQDNMQDMIQKGRNSKMPSILGVLNGKSKLTEEDVLAIRSSNLFQKDLAFKYGISQSQVSCIKRNANWKHVGSH